MPAETPLTSHEQLPLPWDGLSEAAKQHLIEFARACRRNAGLPIDPPEVWS